MAERYSSFADHGRLWLLQRISAALLIFLLAFHFFQLHFLQHAADITFEGSQLRMENPIYYATMLLFLVTATFHGVNGVYNALLNQGIDGRAKAIVKWVLIVASLALVVQGIRLANTLAGVQLL